MSDSGLRPTNNIASRLNAKNTLVHSNSSSNIINASKTGYGSAAAGGSNSTLAFSSSMPALKPMLVNSYSANEPGKAAAILPPSQTSAKVQRLREEGLLKEVTLETNKNPSLSTSSSAALLVNKKPNNKKNRIM
jgi:hypothetical protein